MTDIFALVLPVNNHFNYTQIFPQVSQSAPTDQTRRGCEQHTNLAAPVRIMMLVYQNDTFIIIMFLVGSFFNLDIFACAFISSTRSFLFVIVGLN